MCCSTRKRFQQKLGEINASQNQVANESKVEAGMRGDISSKHNTVKDDQLRPTLYKDLEEYYSFLGTRCGYDAFSVELFALTNHENTAGRKSILVHRY